MAGSLKNIAVMIFESLALQILLQTSLSWQVLKRVAALFLTLWLQLYATVSPLPLFYTKLPTSFGIVHSLKPS